MRCPACGADEQEPGSFCGRCRHRLFAWLGDAFGSLELQSTIAAVRTRSAQGISVSKLMVWIGALCVLILLSPGWAAFRVVMGIVVIQRWSDVGWKTWGGLLGGTLLLATVWNAR